jgi:predicted AlkP superfamily phosphohydrolase/phosphomutase
MVSKGRNRGRLRHLFLSFADVDWSRTRAYSLGTTGQVYINLQEREPQGIVAPGSEYETLRDELIGRLREMCDPDTGQPLVDEVYRREELYSGPYLHLMPDLIFVPRGFVYNAFGEYEFASRSLVDASQGITGWHRMDGVLIMAGDGIAQGRANGGAQLVDLAPTILHLLGLGVPSGLDGRVLYEALALDADLPQDVLPLSAPEYALPALSPTEASEITDRLRNLGYLS